MTPQWIVATLGSPSRARTVRAQERWGSRFRLPSPITGDFFTAYRRARLGGVQCAYRAATVTERLLLFAELRGVSGFLHFGPHQSAREGDPLCQAQLRIHRVDGFDQQPVVHCLGSTGDEP